MKKKVVFLTRFNREALDNFFNRIKEYPEYSRYTRSATHFLGYTSLLDDEVLFYSTIEERKLLNLEEALIFLDKAPFMERASVFLASRIKRSDAPKVAKSIANSLK